MVLVAREDISYWTWELATFHWRLLSQIMSEPYRYPRIRKAYSVVIPTALHSATESWTKSEGRMLEEQTDPSIAPTPGCN